jgi:hypothetical protein
MFLSVAVDAYLRWKLHPAFLYPRDGKVLARSQNSLVDDLAATIVGTKPWESTNLYPCVQTASNKDATHTKLGDVEGQSAQGRVSME